VNSYTHTTSLSSPASSLAVPGIAASADSPQETCLSVWGFHASMSMAHAQSLRAGVSAGWAAREISYTLGMERRCSVRRLFRSLPRRPENQRLMYRSAVRASRPGGGGGERLRMFCSFSDRGRARGVFHSRGDRAHSPGPTGDTVQICISSTGWYGLRSLLMKEEEEAEVRLPSIQSLDGPCTILQYHNKRTRSRSINPPTSHLTIIDDVSARVIV